MRAPSIALTTLLCLSAALAVQGVLRQQEAPPADVIAAEEPALDPPMSTARKSLVGRVLIAAPGMADPYFSGTLIYMLDDDETGALGVVLNRPLPKNNRVWEGGPVSRHMLVLHDRLEDPRSIAAGSLAVTANPSEDLFLFGRLRAFVGYAGWGAGQLDHEIAQGAWWVSDVEAPLILGEDTTALVSAAYRGARPASE